MRDENVSGIAETSVSVPRAVGYDLRVGLEQVETWVERVAALAKLQGLEAAQAQALLAVGALVVVEVEKRVRR